MCVYYICQKIISCVCHKRDIANYLQYLRSVRPLLNEEDYLRMRKLAEEFQNGIGVKLQRYLVLKSW